MIEEVYMPRWGITMEEGTIVEWLVAEGDHVTAGEPLCEAETEKMAQAIESPLDGKVVQLLHEPGAIVPVGQVILLMEPVEGTG